MILELPRFLIIVLLVVVSAAYEEIIPPTKTTELEARKVSPYTANCRRFRLVARYANVRHVQRRLGFLSFTAARNSVLTRDPREAAHFVLGTGGTLRTRGFYIGSRFLAPVRGWGPLKTHQQRILEDHVWEVDGNDQIHMRSPRFTYGNGEAVFCLSTPVRPSDVFAQYFGPVPAQFKCAEIKFIAQCVDKGPGPNPSGGPHVEL